LKQEFLTPIVKEVGEILHFGWQRKKEMAEGITNPVIDEIYETALKTGATWGKISGAGGGGFMMFYSSKNTKYKVMEALSKFGGEFRQYQFTRHGLKTWRVWLFLIKLDS